MRPILSGYILLTTLARSKNREKSPLQRAGEAGVIGRRVTELMREAGKHPSQLGAEVGLPTDKVRAVLSGNLIPSPERLAKIAEALDSDVDSIVNPDRYLTAEAAALCEIHRETLVRWVHNGKLTGERADNGRWWVDLSEVRALLADPEQLRAPTGGKAPHPPVGDLGTRIFAEMRRQNLKQTQVVALCIDVTQSRLSTIIRGQYSPNVERLRQIAAALDTTAAELLKPPTEDDLRIIAEAGLKPAA